MTKFDNRLIMSDRLWVNIIQIKNPNDADKIHEIKYIFYNLVMNKSNRVYNIY